MKNILLVNILVGLSLLVPGHDSHAGKTGTYYTIHGASYQKPENALNHVNSLKTLGYEAAYKKVTIPGKGVWYRVYIGKYADKDEARKIARKLEASRAVDAFALHEWDSQTSAGVSTVKDRTSSAASAPASRAPKEREKQRKGRSEDKGGPRPEQDNARTASENQGGEPLKNLHTGAAQGETGTPEQSPAPSAPAAAERDAPPANPADRGTADAAMRLFDAGNYEQAIGALKALNRQKLAPDTKKLIIMRLADSYYFLGEKGDNRQFIIAVDYYKDLLTRYPDPSEGNALVYYRMALCYEKLKFYYEALGAFEKLLVKYPDSPYQEEASFKAGMLLRETRKQGKAIERLSAYMKKYPHGERARIAAFSIADCYYQLHQKDSAENWYVYVQKKWPTGELFFQGIPKDALRNFGNHSFEMHRFAEAIEVFSRYLSLYPEENNKAVLYAMADAYRETNQYNAAVKLFSHVIERYPGSKEAQEAAFMMATIGVTKPGMKFPSFMAGVSSYNDPIKAYDSLLEKNPPETLKEKLLFQKALALENNGRHKEAVDVYGVLLKRFVRGKYGEESRKNLSRNVVLAVNKYHESGDDVAIADLYFKVFAGGLLKAGDPDVMEKSGESLKNLGLYDDAAAVFGDMARSPRDTREEARVLLALADLDRLRGRTEAAEEKLAGLLKRPIKDGEVLKNIKINLANIYSGKKQYEKAIPLYAEALGAGGDAAGSTAAEYLNYGDALRERNMLAPAVANYQTAIKVYNRNRRQYAPDIAAHAYLGLGDSLFQERKYQEGLPMYQQVLSLAPEQNYKWWSLYHAGQGYTRLNNTTMADASFNQLRGSGKDGFWEKVSNYWIEDDRWFEKNIRRPK